MSLCSKHSDSFPVGALCFLTREVPHGGPSLTAGIAKCLQGRRDRERRSVTKYGLLAHEYPELGSGKDRIQGVDQRADAPDIEDNHDLSS